MNHETTFTHSDPNRFARQELAFQALINRHADECLTAFAEKVDLLLTIGFAYMAGMREGVPADELTRMLRRPEPELSRLEALAIHWGDIEVEQLYRGAVWAYIHGRLLLTDLDRLCEDKRGSLQILEPGTQFAQSVAEWTLRREAGELPTPGLVVYHLGGDLGAVIDKYTYSEIFSHLGYAFAEAQLPSAVAEAIVAYYYGHWLTQRLAYEIATEAIAQALRIRERVASADRAGEAGPSGITPNDCQEATLDTESSSSCCAPC